MFSFHNGAKVADHARVFTFLQNFDFFFDGLVVIDVLNLFDGQLKIGFFMHAFVHGTKRSTRKVLTRTKMHYQIWKSYP